MDVHSHPAFASEFVNPRPSVIVPNRSPAASVVVTDQAKPTPGRPDSMPSNVSPAMASPVVSPVPSGLPYSETQLNNMRAANFSLLSKLEEANGKLKKWQTERSELLDRLEQALLQATKLKDAQSERNEYMAKFEQADAALKEVFQKLQRTEQTLVDRESELTSLRAKYFSERNKNDALLKELRLVSSVSELAKQELNNQLDRVCLRETQLMTARSLKNTTDDELNAAASLYDTALRKTALWDELGGGSIQRQLEPSPFDSPDFSRWRNCQRLQSTSHAGQLMKGFLVGPNCDRGTLFNDGNLRLDIEFSIFRPENCTVVLSVTNVSPSLIKGVAVLPVAQKESKSYDFALNSAASDGSPSFLRPGQSVKVNACIKIFAPYFPEQVPSLCLTYVQPDGAPKNVYLRIPIPFVKFVTALSPPSASAFIDKWNEFQNFQIQYLCNPNSESMMSFSNVVTLGEMNGLLGYQRGLDPNPRGALFSGAWGAGNHGCVQEIIARIELSPASWAGPPVCRVTVRTPSILLSDSVARSLIHVIG